MFDDWNYLANSNSPIDKKAHVASLPYRSAERMC